MGLNNTKEANYPSEDLLTGIWQTSVVSVPQLGSTRLVGPIGECRNQPPYVFIEKIGNQI